MFNVSLNKNDAIAGSGGSARIDAIGKYKGAITLAKVYEVKSGAVFVQINFESDNGQTARLSMCTKSKEGKDTFGFKQLQAIMACVKVKSLNAVEKEIEDYDFEQGKIAKVTRHVFPELMGKKIGFILYRHDQVSREGKEFFTMEIAAPFQYDTELTASEIMEQKVNPEQLPKVLANTKNKVTAAKHDADPYSSYAASASMHMQRQNDDFDSDLPF